MPDTSTSRDERVSTLELFFDLVFVFTITQVALIVERRPGSVEAIAQAFAELLVIYWMYGGFAWLTNTLGTATIRQRVVLLAGMAAFLVVSLAVPRAFGADGVAFGVAYLVLTVVHLAGFLLRGSTTFPAMVRIGGTNLIAASLILAAGFTHGWWHWPFWLAAIVVQVVPPLVTGSANSFAINVGHFAERHGLMVIIVLGESLISVAVAAQELPLDAGLVLGALCGLAASAALWWAYFGGEDAAAEAAYRLAPEQDRGRLALIGYDLSHVLMMAGVIALAAGSRTSLPDLTARTPTAAAGLIAGGSATYLLGLAVFRAVLGYAAPWPRLAFAALLAATVPLGTRLGAAQQLVGVAVVITALLVTERATGGAPNAAEPSSRRAGRRVGHRDRAGWRP